MSEYAKPSKSGTALKACPFCKGKPTLDSFGLFAVECSGCGNRMGAFEDEQTAVAFWNRRDELKAIRAAFENRKGLTGADCARVSAGEISMTTKTKTHLNKFKAVSNLRAAEAALTDGMLL